MPDGSGGLLLVRVVVDFLEVRIDDVVLGRFRRIGAVLALGLFGLGRLVHGLAELHRRFGKPVALGLDGLGVGFRLLDFGLQVLDRRADRGAILLGDLVAIVLKRLLGRMQQALGLVLRLDGRATLLVGVGIGLGVLDHLLDIGVGQTTGSLDGDPLLLVGALVLGRHVDDAVGVDVEGDLDLRHAARCRRDALEVEPAERLVVLRHLAFALEDLDGHGVLRVLGGGEHLALLGRDRGVAIDQAGEHATQRLDAERQRRHVEQQHVLDVALQNAGLDGGAHRDDLIRVDALVRLLAEQVLHRFLDLRHAGHAADQNDLVDVRRGDAGILEGRLARIHRALHEVVHQALELGARQLHGQVLGTRRIGGDERQVDFGLRGRGQLDLGLLGGLLEALQGELVVLQVDALVLLELRREVIDQTHVEVFAAEEGVAIGGLHLEDAVTDLQDRHVEGATAQIVDGDGLAVVLVEAVGQRRRGRLVDDAQDVETGNLAGVLGRLTLGVVEVGRNGDDRLLDLLAEIGLGGFLHLLQDHRRDLRRRIFLAGRLDPGVAIVGIDDLVGDHALVFLRRRILEGPANQALDRKQRVFGIGDRLALGRLADEALAVVGEGHHGGRGARALGILDHLGILAVHDRDAGIGRAKVDSDYLRHA
ncbi:putative glutamate dehydrogenase [Aurantimonas manganoxydans SI85-9A1]|uniref:Putative glutamate dehydrogenase n=1 Tax=Aurantimonas manganoxydans (strain ATCC BAA-1229 / DSM 21871 / SI85-9A1) TaxID=287752 RepID=Q1YET4_AURMS|nr:putative glutamate dehydrogenase [Aurantimonas manganoxydans SI85-9A1]